MHPQTSTASGLGLVSGVVGEPFKFAVQSKDERAYEQQTIVLHTHHSDPRQLVALLRGGGGGGGGGGVRAALARQAE